MAISIIIAVNCVISLICAALCYAVALKSKLSSPVSVRSLEKLRLTVNELHADQVSRMSSLEAEMQKLDSVCKSLKGTVAVARRESKRNAQDRMLELAIAQMQSAGVPLQVPPNQQP